MRYLFEAGKRRRVMHLCGYDSWTGLPTMTALCGIGHAFDRTVNVPLGRRVCKRCTAEAERGSTRHE